MWEWRIFFREESSTLSSFLTSFNKLVIKSSIEVRSDCYYNLFDKSNGLKERGCSDGLFDLSKLELKIQLDERDNGLLFWDKIIKKPLFQSGFSKKDGINPTNLIQYLKEEQKQADDRFSKIIKEIILILEKEDPPLIEIKKERKQIWLKYDEHKKFQYGNKIQGEITNFELNGFKWQTFCLEGSDPEYIEKILIDWLPLKEIFIGGYPEFILKYF